MRYTCSTCKGEETLTCPNGCEGRKAEGCHGRLVPDYCNVKGCDVESPGRITCPTCEGNGFVEEDDDDE